MKTTSYYIKARFFPTLLTVIPLLILVNVIIAPVYHNSLSQIFDILPHNNKFGALWSFDFSDGAGQSTGLKRSFSTFLL